MQHRRNVDRKSGVRAPIAPPLCTALFALWACLFPSLARAAPPKPRSPRAPFPTTIAEFAALRVQKVQQGDIDGWVEAVHAETAFRARQGWPKARHFLRSLSAPPGQRAEAELALLALELEAHTHIEALPTGVLGSGPVTWNAPTSRVGLEGLRKPIASAWKGRNALGLASRWRLTKLLLGLFQRLHAAELAEGLHPVSVTALDLGHPPQTQPRLPYERTGLERGLAVLEDLEAWLASTGRVEESYEAGLKRFRYVWPFVKQSPNEIRELLTALRKRRAEIAQSLPPAYRSGDGTEMKRHALQSTALLEAIFTTNVPSAEAEGSARDLTKNAVEISGFPSELARTRADSEEASLNTELALVGERLSSPSASELWLEGRPPATLDLRTVKLHAKHESKQGREHSDWYGFGMQRARTKRPIGRAIEQGHEHEQTRTWKVAFDGAARRAGGLRRLPMPAHTPGAYLLQATPDGGRRGHPNGAQADGIINISNLLLWPNRGVAAERGLGVHVLSLDDGKPIAGAVASVWSDGVEHSALSGPDGWAWVPFSSARLNHVYVLSARKGTDETLTWSHIHPPSTPDADPELREAALRNHRLQELTRSLSQSKQTSPAGPWLSIDQYPKEARLGEPMSVRGEIVSRPARPPNRRWQGRWWLLDSQGNPYNGNELPAAARVLQRGDFKVEADGHFSFTLTPRAWLFDSESDTKRTFSYPAWPHRSFRLVVGAAPANKSAHKDAAFLWDDVVFRAGATAASSVLTSSGRWLEASGGKGVELNWRTFKSDAVSGEATLTIEMLSPPKTLPALRASPNAELVSRMPRGPLSELSPDRDLPSQNVAGMDAELSDWEVARTIGQQSVTFDRCGHTYLTLPALVPGVYRIRVDARERAIEAVSHIFVGRAEDLEARGVLAKLRLYLLPQTVVPGPDAEPAQTLRWLAGSGYGSSSVWVDVFDARTNELVSSERLREKGGPVTLRLPERMSFAPLHARATLVRDHRVLSLSQSISRRAVRADLELAASVKTCGPVTCDLEITLALKSSYGAISRADAAFRIIGGERGTGAGCRSPDLAGDLAGVVAHPRQALGLWRESLRADVVPDEVLSESRWEKTFRQRRWPAVELQIPEGEPPVGLRQRPEIPTEIVMPIGVPTNGEAVTIVRRVPRLGVRRWLVRADVVTSGPAAALSHEISVPATAR